MKRFALLAVAALIVLGYSGDVHAGGLTYSGYQPWWNPFALFRRPKITPEEERLQKFWHDYYDALHSYYGSLDHIDWVAYYKNHGYEINNGGSYTVGPNGTLVYSGGRIGGGGGIGGGNRTNYAPVVVTPGMSWAVPPQPLGGPPVVNGPLTAAPQPSGFQGYASPMAVYPGGGYAGQGYPMVYGQN